MLELEENFRLTMITIDPQLTDEPLYQKLHQHLSPSDDDEHGAVIAAGIVETPCGIRLLAHEVFPAQDGIDYEPRANDNCLDCSSSSRSRRARSDRYRLPCRMPNV